MVETWLLADEQAVMKVAVSRGPNPFDQGY
jgi:hypothetical protein